MDIKEFILAKCLKGQSDIEIITEKDYISQPKPNGYRSLHLTIRLLVFFAEKEIMRTSTEKCLTAMWQSTTMHHFI